MSGLTNDKTRLDAVRAFRDAAVADGWEISPTYRSESQDRVAHLVRDGFVMMIVTRDEYEASVSIWGPDGLHIKPPSVYDWQAIQDRVNTCNECGAKGPTVRFSFAGRCCNTCLPGMREKYEKPGWNR